MKKGKWVIGLLICIIIVYFFHPFILKKVFSVKYREEIINYSKEFQVDPYLVAAIMKVESNFDPYAQSHKGAMGLMQIMPSTGNWVAKEISLDNFYLQELYVPEVNIKIGTWYLQTLSNQFNGDIHLILAAYNGGSGNVSKWLLDKRYSNDGKNLEYIPFRETRNYVEKVLFYYNLYRRIYDSNEF